MLEHIQRTFVLLQFWPHFQVQLQRNVSVFRRVASCLFESNLVKGELFDALTMLQHRGQESAGIASSDGDHVTVVKDMGLVSNVFDDRTLAALEWREIPRSLTAPQLQLLDTLLRDGTSLRDAFEIASNPAWL